MQPDFLNAFRPRSSPGSGEKSFFQVETAARVSAAVMVAAAAGEIFTASIKTEAVKHYSLNYALTAIEIYIYIFILHVQF